MRRGGPSPRVLSRLFEEAAEAWRRQEYEVTLARLEKARRLDPSNVGILLDLGRAHGLRYDYAAAERCLEEAVRASGDRAGALAEAGRRCQEFGHYGLALAFLGRAAAEPGVRPATLLALAELHERHHRLDEAEGCVQRVLALDQRHAPGRLVQARLMRHRGALEAAERLVGAVLGESGVDVGTRIRAGYEMGALLDRQGRYDEAMRVWVEAKAQQLPAAAGYQRILAGVQARVREMEGELSGETFKRWGAGGGGAGTGLRLAVLCGHPRSGTTLLEQALDAHPDVVTAEETHILHDEAYLPLTRGFAPDAPVMGVLDSASRERLERSRGDYLRFTELFTGKAVGSRLLVDKNPALNVLLPAVARIFPEARFLVALRDPRDVCLSCFMQPLALNPVSSAYLTLEGTVTQYLSVMAFWRFLKPRLAQPWLEVRYEEVVEDLEREGRRVLEFLGVGWDPVVLRFHEHARSQPVRSPSYADVVKPVYRGARGRWRHYARHLEPQLARLDPLLQELGYL